MQSAASIAMGTAVTVGVVHTFLGVDHYLPFVVLGRAEGWTLRKTLSWTFLCGLGHVLSSVIIGVLGATLGWAVGNVEAFESRRGQLAAVALIGFGLFYFVWGLWRGHRHAHSHVHSDGSHHDHPHPHGRAASDVAHPAASHDETEHVRRHRRTAWVLFIIFVLGPCEALIPLVMAPAVRHDLGGCLGVAISFSAATVASMLLLVALGSLGMRFVRVQLLERHAQALAGLAILVSGILIQALGI